MMVIPSRRVTVDLPIQMVRELDREAIALKVSRQAVIKMLVREGLDLRWRWGTSSRKKSLRLGRL